MTYSIFSLFSISRVIIQLEFITYNASAQNTRLNKSYVPIDGSQ